MEFHRTRLSKKLYPSRFKRGGFNKEFYKFFNKLETVTAPVTGGLFKRLETAF